MDKPMDNRTRQARPGAVVVGGSRKRKGEQMQILIKKRGNAAGVNVALLILRLVLGGIMMGHGCQKLFGWFKGSGMQGTSGWMESMGMRPSTFWAALAGGAEFGGGLLTALGFLNPAGPLGVFGAM